MTIASLLAGTTEVVPTAVQSVWEIATSNPLSAFYMGVGILGLGFVLFRRARKTVH